MLFVSRFLEDSGTLCALYFNIDATNSSITVANLTRLDREAIVETISSDVFQCCVVFYVTTNSITIPNRATVIIEVTDENDCIPFFFGLRQPHQINVTENAAIPTPLLNLQPTDGDEGANGATVFSITSGNEDEYFRIRVPEGETESSTTNRILFLVRELNFEELQSDTFSLTIALSDLGSMPHSVEQHIHIRVVDLEDEPPTFETTSYVFNVTENSPVGYHFAFVQAGSDQTTGNVFYSFCTTCNKDPENVDNIIGVDISTGGLFLKVPVDFEMLSLLRFEITASNPITRGTQTTNVQVEIIDVNEHSPYFQCFGGSLDCRESVNGSVYSMDESFNNTARLLILQVADDDPTQEFKKINDTSLLLETDPPDSPFNVTYKRLGFSFDLVRIDLSGPLDRETAHVITFTLSVENQAVPSLRSETTITFNILDVNDNVPNFTQELYEGSIFEGSPVGVELFRVDARDPDFGENGTVTYSLTNVQEEAARDWFHVSPENGMVSVNSSDIDYLAVSGTVTLTITASDQGETPLNSSVTAVITILPSSTFIAGSYQEYSDSDFNLLDGTSPNFYIEFRTLTREGLLAYQRNSNGDLFAVEVEDGGVVVRSGGSVIKSRDYDVSNDHWHAVHVERGTNQVSTLIQCLTSEVKAMYMRAETETTLRRSIAAIFPACQ